MLKGDKILRRLQPAVLEHTESRKFEDTLGHTFALLRLPVVLRPIPCDEVVKLEGQSSKAAKLQE